MGLTKMASGVSFPWHILFFLKVLRILKGLFQKSLKRGQGQSPSFFVLLVLCSPYLLRLKIRMSRSREAREEARAAT